MRSILPRACDNFFIISSVSVLHKWEIMWFPKMTRLQVVFNHTIVCLYLLPLDLCRKFGNSYFQSIINV